MKRFYAAIILTLIASLTSAYTITDINLWVGGDGYILAEEKIIVEGGFSNSQITIPAYVKDLTVADELGRVKYEITGDGAYKTLNMTFEPLDAGENKTIWVKYGTPQLTKKEGVNWTISYSTLASPRMTIVRVNMPIGSSFLNLKPDKLLRSHDKYAVWIFPQEDSLDLNFTYEYSGSTTPGNQSSGNGNNSTMGFMKGFMTINTVLVALASIVFLSGIIYLAWRMELFKKEIKEKKDDAITVSVEKPGEIVKGPTIVGGGDSLSYDIEGGAAKRRGKRIVKDSVLKMLDEKELNVVKILESSDDEELTQAYVHKTTGIPKSSLSDIIKRLEKRNILETTSQGRIKWLKLQKWSLE
ncbi:MAG: hypothetical protein NTU61_03450 [Candidatus Altiarchaeota archaeon]|nr:hypothetical protein [Candidatus Altiarchaeota archaeon]